MKSFIALQKKLCQLLLKCAKKQNCGSFKLTAARFLIYLFIKFTYFCADDIGTLKKKILLKDKKPLTAIKTSSKYKNL